MLNVFICDDEPEICAALEDMVRTILSGREHTIRLYGSRAELESALQDGIRADIALLDIRLEEENGIGAAQALFPEGSRTQVIFVTGYPEYHSDAYEAEHIWFILKPVEEADLRRALDKALRRLEKRGPRDLTLITRTQTFRIPMGDIRYIESFGRKMVIYRAQEALELYGKISSLGEQLNTTFVRCHQSYFVNMAYVARMETNYFVLKDGEEVPISQLRRNATRKQYLKYLSTGI